MLDPSTDREIDRSPDPPYQVVMVMSDFSMLSDKAMVHGIRLSRAFGTILYVLHVLPQSKEQDRKVGDDLSGWEKVTDSASQEAYAASDAILELLGRFDAIGHPVIRRGDVIKAALEAVEDLSVDVIVMGWPTDSGLLGRLKGNLAEQLQRQVSVPVLLVH